jgi:cytochrome b
MTQAAQTADFAAEDRTIAVWDPLVRLFHWSLVVSFFVAYFTEDEAMALHVWAGYAVAGLVLLRLVWGFVGPRHARFSDFIFAPLTVWRYLFDLLQFRSARYVGHSPAGGAMILALLLGVAATVGTGLQTYALRDNAGPLAPFVAAAPTADAAAVKQHRQTTHFWKEVHELMANLTLLLVFAHVGGVVLASVAHRENLARAMITGRKRPN